MTLPTIHVGPKEDEGYSAILDRNSRVPLNEQLANHFRALIERQQLTPGTVLPKEIEFASRLKVSRQTVNQAYTRLAMRGLVNRQRGVGTFVAHPFVEQPLDQLYSFIHTLTAQGRAPSTQLLGRKLVLDDRASLELLGQPGKMVSEITRLRLVDDEPFVIESLYLESPLVEPITTERLESEVFYDILADLFGIVVTHAIETLHPITVDRAEATLLRIDVNEPAFLVERKAFAGERVIEYRRSVIRGDRYRFKVRLERSAIHSQ